MQLTVNIDKTNLVFLLIAVFVVMGIGLAVATTPNPGHDVSELDFTGGFTVPSGDVVITSGNMEISSGDLMILAGKIVADSLIERKCENMGYDGGGYGTLVCPTSDGIVLVKTSNGDNTDRGIGDAWHTAKHLSGNSFTSCVNMGYDGKGYGTAVCSGHAGVALVKTSNGGNTDRGISDSWHTHLHQTGVNTKKCENMGYDGGGYGTAVCPTSNGIILVKTSNGNNVDKGISDSWHTHKHLSGSFSTCENMGYDGKGYGTASCSGSSGVALVKTSNGGNTDRGISDSWHVALH